MRDIDQRENTIIGRMTGEIETTTDPKMFNRKGVTLLERTIELTTAKGTTNRSIRLS
jgi:hypothetical protein